MLRDIVIGYFFGTSVLASAFVIAFTIPNLFRRLFGEGALSAAFIPVFIETRKKKGDSAAWDLAAKVVTMAASFLTAIAVVGVIAFSVLINLPMVSADWAAIFELARIMFPYVLLICMAALAMAVLNSFKHFSTSAFAPCLLNIILIGIMLIGFPIISDKPFDRALLLSWGVLLAGVAQILIQLPALKRFGCPFKFSSRWNDPQIRKMLLLMGPAALGMAVTQFNVLIDRFLAMWIGSWAPAALFFSERWVYLPLGVIATAMSTVLLPTFSTHATDKNHAAMSGTISDSLRHLFFIMTPASIGLLLLAPNVIQAAMEWGGTFDAESTFLTSRALIFYAPGLITFSGAKVLVPAFYGLQDTKTPVRVGFISITLNLLMNIIFILTLPTYWKHAGMALSTVLAGAVNVTILGFILNKRIGNIQWNTIFKSIVRSLMYAGIMGVAVWLISVFSKPVLLNLLPSKFAEIFTVILSVGGGAATYFMLAIGFKNTELKEIAAAMRKK